MQLRSGNEQCAFESNALNIGCGIAGLGSTVGFMIS